MEKRILLFAIFILAYSGIPAQKPIDTSWFQDAKLGLFIHWGLYSQTAGQWNGIPSRGGEHFMLYERISLKDYARIADDFNPVSFNAEKWVKTAKHAGMKYIVYTSKHHDGFAMYDSQCSDYNIVKKTPYRRDPLKELAEACKKEGIKLGIYYSLGRDWEDPDVPTWNAHRSNIWDYPNERGKVLQKYLDRKVYPQLRELLTNYGEIALIWFDTPEATNKKQSQEILDFIHSLQPNCLVNSRVGNQLGDFDTSNEQRLATDINQKPWETCMTMGRNWGYNRYDVDYKSPSTLICHLVDIVSKGGNFLLNVSPKGNGQFPELSFPVFNTFHNWLGENGEAIYGVKPWKTFGENYDSTQLADTSEKVFHDAEYDGTPKENIPDFRFTAKDNNIYIFARNIEVGRFTLKSFSESDKIKSIRLLENGQKINWKITKNGLEVKIPYISPAKIPVYVLKVETTN